MKQPYGEIVSGLSADGRPVRAGAFDEHQVRAAAGLTMVVGAVAFAQAWYAKEYAAIQAVTVLFAIEFALRVGLGLRWSPFGWLASALVRGQAPQWVSARPKRFAWSLGLGMSLAMAVITNIGIRGALPFTVCLVCLALMWLEAVLGVCLGCEIHAWLVRRGWARHDPGYEICSRGVCSDAKVLP